MRKQKKSMNYINDSLLENVNMSTPSPDHGMIYKGSDMYWYPEKDITYAVKINSNKNIIDLV